MAYASILFSLWPNHGDLRSELSKLPQGCASDGQGLRGREESLFYKKGVDTSRLAAYTVSSHRRRVLTTAMRRAGTSLILFTQVSDSKEVAT